MHKPKDGEQVNPTYGGGRGGKDSLVGGIVDDTKVGDDEGSALLGGTIQVEGFVGRANISGDQHK